MLICHFCRRTIESTEAAIAEDWVPSFYEPGAEDETMEPVCSECADKHLELVDGEIVQVTD